MLEEQNYSVKGEMKISTYDEAYQYKKVTQHKPNYVYPQLSKVEKCEHKRIDRWNHGYHAECLDCGKQLY